MQRQLKTLVIDPAAIARPAGSRALHTEPLDAEATVFDANPWGAWAAVPVPRRPPLNDAANLPTVTVCEAPEDVAPAPEQVRLRSRMARWGTAVRGRIPSVRAPKRVWVLAGAAAFAAVFTLAAGLARHASTAPGGARASTSGEEQAPLEAEQASRVHAEKARAESSAQRVAEAPAVHAEEASAGNAEKDAKPAPALKAEASPPAPRGGGPAGTPRSVPASARQAVDLLIAGRRDQALAEYERLARATPEDPSYAAAARILRREQSSPGAMLKEPSP